MGREMYDFENAEKKMHSFLKINKYHFKIDI